MTKKRIMLLLLLLVALAMPVTASQWRSRIDLKRLLDDPDALQQMTIRYTYPDRRGEVFYLHGDGVLVLQQLPTQRGVWNSLLPTCTLRVTEETIKGMVRLLIEKHFFDLPEKHFLFMYASDEPEEEVHIHSIVVDTQDERAARSFATGTYANQTQSIPPDFAAIEVAIQRIRDNAFPLSKACGVAAPVKF